MRFKIDENLPVEAAELLRSHNHDSMMVQDQGLKGCSDAQLLDVCTSENRVLVTLDLDFADIRNYPPKHFNGIMVLRIRRHDKTHVSKVIKTALSLLDTTSLTHTLWIVEEDQIRIRE